MIKRQNNLQHVPLEQIILKIEKGKKSQDENTYNGFVACIVVLFIGNNSIQMMSNLHGPHQSLCILATMVR